MRFDKYQQWSQGLQVGLPLGANLALAQQEWATRSEKSVTQVQGLVPF